MTSGKWSDLTWLDRLKGSPTIAVIRAPTLDTGRQMAAAAVAGGLSFVEIAWNSDRPAQLLGVLREAFPHCQIGAGSLRNADEIRGAVAAGAQFLFSPHTQMEMLHAARVARIPLVPGALTPTEILTAWERGATAVKVFPVSVMGGDRYLRSLRAPLAGVPLIPTGGVTPENARSFLEAGAVAVGVSTGLFPPHLLAAGDWGKIEALARQLRQATADVIEG